MGLVISDADTAACAILEAADETEPTGHPPGSRAVDRPGVAIAATPRSRTRGVSQALLHLFLEQKPQFAAQAGRHFRARNPSTKISVHRASPPTTSHDLADDLDPLPHVAERGYAANLPEHLVSPPRETPDHNCPSETSASRFPLVQFSIRPRSGSSRPGVGFAPAYIRFCRLIDVSMNGLAIVTTHPLTAGTELAFWIADTPPRPHLELQGTVLRCEALQRDEGFRIVCRLSRFLSFPEIHRIGRTLFDASIV